MQAPPFLQLNDALAATRAKIEKLARAAEMARTVGELRQELAKTQTENERLMAELRRARIEVTERQRAGQVERQEAARLRDQLSTAQAELAKAGEARAAAEQERDAARLQTAFLAGRLRADLAATNGKLEQVMAKNGELEAELVSLRAAAASAADAAQENMRAFESRIEALDAALQGVAPTVEAGSDNLGAAGQPASSKAPPREQPNGAADVTGSRSSQIRSSIAPDQAGASDPKAAAAPNPLTDLTVGLAPEARLQAQRLLEDLDAKADRRGLMITIPGAALFQSNSERIDAAAHETLAKLAELVKLYDDRKTLIVGHTDAYGEAAYNQYLATRRAEVIKKFFVENFEIEQTRLSIEGKGEEQPIASNATQDGRTANRRARSCC